jgi:ABC-type branched-subunit amino acid transport system permease subunit
MRIPVTQTRPPAEASASGSQGLVAARLTRGALDGALWLGALVVALLVPVVIHGFVIKVLTLCLVYTVVLISVVVLTGYVGQMSLCQASFMGLGAYLTAALMGHYGWSFWVAAPVACVLVFLAGIAVGLPALRLRGLTLAIVTLSLALLADSFLFVNVGWLTNNSNGWRIDPPKFLNVPLSDQTALYRVILAATALTVLAVIQLRRGRTGKSWFAMRDAEIAAATSGVPIVSMKLLGFGVAAALAALGGVLFTLTIGAVSPQPFNFVASIQLLAIAVIAGIRSLPGAVVGAVFYIVLPQFLQQFPALVPLTPLILGAGLILQTVFAPQGLGGVLEDAETRLFRSVAGASAGRVVAVPAEAAGPVWADRGAAPPGKGGERATV